MVYTGPTRQPEPHGVIKMIPGLTVNPHYSFRSGSDAPYRQWDISVPVERIVAEMAADGWSCTVKYNHFGFPTISCVHMETKAALDALRAVPRE